MTFLAIDIETGGKLMTTHPLISIGTYFFDSKTALFEKRRFTFDFDTEKFEPRCMDEFWSKNLAKLDLLRSDPKSTIADFASYVDSLDKEYPDLILMTDNNAFDITWINYYYEVHLKRDPINYRFDGKFRIIVDQNSYLWALMPWTEDPWISDNDFVTHYNLEKQENRDHLPDNDAEKLLKIFLQAKSQGQSMISGLGY